MTSSSPSIIKHYTLTAQFHAPISIPLPLVHCRACDQPMHVDEASRWAITRTIMCENSTCEHFGFAWTLNLLTGVGVSERPSEEDATSEPPLTAPEFYRPPYPVSPIANAIAPRKNRR